MILFSIIIPTYNNIILFTKAVKSVLSQDFKQFEIIVTDDSSTCEIEQYCRLLGDSRIRYIKRYNKTGGAVGNWNNGLRMVSGKFIIVLHHDEELGDNHFLSRIYASITDGHDLIISEIRVKEEGKSIRKGRINGFLKSELLKNPTSLFLINPIGPCACIAFSRELMDEFDENLSWIVDTEWYYRLLKASKSHKYLVDSIIKSNSGHKDQITLNIDIKEKERSDVNWLKKKYRSNLKVRAVLDLRKIISFLRKVKRLFR